MSAYLFLGIVMLCLQTVSCQNRPNTDAVDDVTSHRIELLEESLNNYVFEAMPKVKVLEEEMKEVKEENVYLRDQVKEQSVKLGNLQWAAVDLMKKQLTKEERNLVTELQWTIFDLKEANRELQEEACTRNTDCKEWAAWSHCSMDCGPGTRVRSRDCVQNGRFSAMCTPDNFQEEKCHGKACDIQQLDCPDNYTSFRGHCFRFSGREDARILSNILCDEEDAHLVHINSDAKQRDVFDYLQIVAPEYMVDLHEDFSKREYWDFKDIAQKTNVAIDGIRRHQQFVFLDFKDSIMTYFHWAVGQPRNRHSDGDYCVTLNVLTGDWYMDCCDKTYYYICETEHRGNI